MCQSLARYEGVESEQDLVPALTEPAPWGGEQTVNKSPQYSAVGYMVDVHPWKTGQGESGTARDIHLGSLRSFPWRR